jgi:sucrose PTS system EIIBCA or EIIBC component
MNDSQIVDQLIAQLGGSNNIASVTNCMTRLRVVVKAEDPVQEQELQSTEKVLGLVHDRANAYEIVVGPGNSRKFADICHEKGLTESAPMDGDWKKNKEAHKAGQKGNPVKDALKVLGDIFVPLIPGIIVAGLCAGFASLIVQLVPDYENVHALYVVWQLLTVVNVSFMAYITAWAGYRAADRFGGTPILGGMMGMIASLSGINEIAKHIGLLEGDFPFGTLFELLSSILQAGKGGVLGVIVGVFVMVLVEKFIRKRMPSNLDVVFTPLLTMIVCIVPYVFVIMPVFGLISSGIAGAFGQACLSENLGVRAIVGFIAASLFLPLVACGVHHGLVALYAVQLQQFGFVTLYPALAMAGAGQVGAAIAIYLAARRLGHKRLCTVIGGALPAGLLGVGEPLIYGVTLPLGRPFITAGLGAGFGGAFVMLCGVASTTWGPSGLVGLLVMTAGEGGALQSIAMYGIGLLISCFMAFLITKFTMKDEMIVQALGGIESTYGETAAELASHTVEAVRSVKHGETIHFGFDQQRSFEHMVKDPVGIHARPAGALAKVAQGFDAEITIRNGQNSASAKSVIELMTLDAAEGSKLEVTVTGKDADKATSALQQFMGKNL